VPLLPHDAVAAAGLQHVAFECPDVLALVRRLRERGAPPLAIPANYYDDLAARTGLDPELVDALREHGVLYDRDAGGELLHLYTPVVGGRLFFEVVQRIGAYDGYGAANAPVRMAAQRAPAPVAVHS
jgi:4-hydroxyphenylpyruvate dioxygenase